MRRRDWSAAREKVEGEGRCRACRRTDRGLEAAHVIGRIHDPKDGKVRAVDVVPLCRECHRAYDARSLSILEVLTLEEQAAAVAHLGMLRALRRVSPDSVVS